MSAMDWLSIFPAFRSSIQAGKNAHDNGANFWQSLGAGLSELFTGSYQEEKELQSTIDAEQRAMENTRQLRDEENAYNSPQAQAERFKQAGINPLSAMTGGAQAASNTVVTSSGGQQSRTDGSLSAMLPFLQFMEQKRLNDSIIDRNNAQTGKLTVDTAIAEWDVKLKEQLYGYNKENYPILLDAGRQKIKNLIAEMNEKNANTDQIRKNIEKTQEEIWLLQLQYFQEEQEIEINEAKLKQMAQDFETGKYRQEYEKWHAEHEKALQDIAITQGKITNAEWEQLWDSGLMKEKTEAERDQIKQVYQKLLAETTQFSSVWNTGDDSIFGTLARYLLYICTEII